MARPIKIPAGSTHKEPSWRAEIERIAAKWKAGGGAGGYFKRAITDFLAWRGPSNRPPKFINGAVGSQPARNTELDNKHIGVGVWFEVECATGQPLLIFLPDLNKQSASSMFRKGNWLIQTDFGFRYLYAPGAVVGILQRGFPKGS